MTRAILALPESPTLPLSAFDLLMHSSKKGMSPARRVLVVMSTRAGQAGDFQATALVSGARGGGAAFTRPAEGSSQRSSLGA